MQEETRNLIIAITLSMGILAGWHFFFEAPRQQAAQARLAAMAEQEPKVAPTATVGVPAAGTTHLLPEQALGQSPRITIESPTLKGSLNLRGARIDDLTLHGYRQTVEPDSPEVVLFSPAGTERVYFAEFGWLAQAGAVTAPTNTSLWRADAQTLTPSQAVNLTWVSPEGIVFKITLALDEHYMFTVTRAVENKTGQVVTLAPYGLISRAKPETEQFFILHEGPLAVLDGTLKEMTYADLKEDKKVALAGEGWLGITDKYWLAAMVPDGAIQSANATYYYKNVDRYQVDYAAEPVAVPARGNVQDVTHFFAGAKKLALLEQYGKQHDIKLFDRAIDFGWFYFMTRPFSVAINWLYSHIGNFGLALMAFTVFIKLLMLPLANKSYRAMSKMKLLHPKIVELRDKYGDDKMKMNQAVMEFYKKEKVNPVSGCLPILLQIPVFFALYKVLFVTIEMRHAPFYGWIRDLSAPDPTSFVNLFGLLPFDAPAFFVIGLWPVIMMITMVLQQRLNPPPSDPMQAKVLQLMPFIFVFIFASFPAGLVIYWSWSNFLSILQQFFIMRVLNKQAEEEKEKRSKTKVAKKKS